MKCLFTILSLFIVICALSQRISKNRLSALIANTPGKQITIDDSKKVGYHCVSTYLYLGKMNDNKNRTLKILTETSYFGGLSTHVSSRILFYNNLNQYIGEYNTAKSPEELPTKLKNGKLIFPFNEGCDRKPNIVDLNRGIPKEIFLPCANGLGNIYSFSSDD